MTGDLQPLDVNYNRLFKAKYEKRLDFTNSKCSREKKLMYILRILVRENARKGTNTFRKMAMNITQSDSDFNA